ncbi:hypothetical protein BJ878DRAFT_557136 [Calycina marina]|uniref:Uncharacterized protein n=1 Tax=Calycina marina TaxID=1763456 RepID=A0A9P8CCC1_9HELO|nr:hypothetical protein BJ878DRAFT_557136 [Calycina marina]
MSSTRSLTGAPLGSGLAFNWVFLVELLVCGIVTLFFLFYFNRVFASIVSLLIRWYTWKWYRVYIDIHALQFSLLGGRVFFKGIKYHGNNETILVHSGYVTWSYWLRNVRELDIHLGRGGQEQRTSQRKSDLDEEDSRNSKDQTDAGDNIELDQGGTNKAPSKLPCRISITLEGAEWFVYNRSMAYDAIVACMAQEYREPGGKSARAAEPGKSEESHEDRSTSRGKSTGSSDESSKETSEQFDTGMSGLSFHATSRTGQNQSSRDVPTPAKLPLLLRFLPIHIDCKRAAVVMGNEHTKSVLITKVDTASGEIDAERSGPLDLYKQLYNFHFHHPVIQMKPNDDYKENQTAAAMRIKRGTSDQTEKDKPNLHTHSFVHRQRRKVWHQLQDMVPIFRHSVESFSSSESQRTGTGPQSDSPGTNSWQGLSRYLEENELDDKARWSSIEYATVSTIVDCPDATVSFYWDAVGTVSDHASVNQALELEKQNINGNPPPDWGINLSLKGGTINYGPWADRQRADLQKVFFPSLCKDAVPSKRIPVGQPRVPTEFKLFIDLDAETTLRVPIKEESKNWKWTKQADLMQPRSGNQKRTANKNRKGVADKGNQSTEVRPFGWLDIKVGANSTINYSMDMVASATGFCNKLELDLPSIEITTSVNHGLLMKSVNNSILCDLSNPLQWNGHHLWKFNIKLDDLELFILREHVFLLIDLVDDWTSGPPPEYLTFSPFQYLVNLHLGDFKFYLNVNDSNIINNPSDFDDNTFISIFGTILDADICIPLDKYRPHRTDITFDVDARHGGLNLHVPPWNTQATFMRNPEIATLKTLAIQGKYQYCATTSPTNTDTLLLNMYGDSLTAQLYGFIIRYYLKIKDNYFGDDIHFKTLEEHQEVLRASKGGSLQDVAGPPHKKSNDLDVILSVSVDKSAMILPVNLYTATDHTRIEIARIEADLRFTNYYMDLEVVLNTLALSQGNEDDGLTTPLSVTSRTQAFVDGVTVTGNRLFGLPPTEPTYVCNWDFAVGAISGECTAEFFSHLASGVKALAFSFDDDENALPVLSELILHDVTFLRATVESIRVWLHVEEAAFMVSAGNVTVNFNDWAGPNYSGKLNVSIPDFEVACVDAESASRHRSRTQHPVKTHALIRTTLSLTMISRKLGFTEGRKLQQEHIKRHDQRTRRTNFLLHEGYADDSMLTTVDPPAMCVPPMPSLARRMNGRTSQSAVRSSSASRTFSSRPRRAIRRRRSFLSLSSSSQQSSISILRPPDSCASGDCTQSASRSRSLHTGIDQSTQLRDVSRSSFYSAVAEHKGLAPSTVTFSSPFIAPYFPLQEVEPDARHVPSISEQESDSYSDDLQSVLDDADTSGLDENTTLTSFMLELPVGIVGVLNPDAVNAVLDLLSALKPAEPKDILDELQIDTITKVFDLNKQKKKTGSVFDLSVRTPGIALRFLSSTDTYLTQSPASTVYDQYDLSLSGVALIMRSKTLATETVITDGDRESAILHFSLISINASAKERLSFLDDAQAAVNATVDDIVFWYATSGTAKSSMTLKDVEVTTASSKVEYLASLVHRTTVISNTLADSYAVRVAQQKHRLQLFTYLVTIAGQEATDPSLLVRPSYVLRSAQDHLRTRDSWKIITRLHHMYTSLDATTRRDITMRCLSNTDVLPEDAKQQVHRIISRWRGWDLPNVDRCLVMGRVWGSSSPVHIRPTESTRPMQVSFRIDFVRLILDPGPKQNEVSLSTLNASVDIGFPTEQAQNTTIEVFCGNGSINLNWELCELANNILRLQQESQQAPKSPSAYSVAPPIDAHIKKKQTLHVICFLDEGLISMETINIMSRSVSKGLKASFILVDGDSEDVRQTMNLMMAAVAATSKTTSHSQTVAICQLRNPSVYASSETKLLSAKPHTSMKLAANCQELVFQVKQDIQVLVEILDLLIGDEVAQIYIMANSAPARHDVEALSNPLAKTNGVSRVNIALFLDKYHVSLPLLQSLIYTISGNIARGSVAAQLGSEVVFDFDIKEHAHDVQTSEYDKFHSISLLQMPPTNGRVTAHISEQENSVSVFASVEAVELDAAPIHSLLTAINRPEIASVLSDIQEDIKGVQSHVEEVFGTEKKPASISSKSEGKPFIYSVHLTLAGFDVSAKATGAGQHQQTHLDFNLGSIQMVLTNRLEQSGPPLEYPEMNVGLRHILFELARSNNGSMEPCGNLGFAAYLTATSKQNDMGDFVRSFHVQSDALEVNLFAETASSIVDIITNLQQKIKDIDLTREKKYLRRLRKSKPRIAINDDEATIATSIQGSSIMFASMYSLELLSIRVSWLVGKHTLDHNSGIEPEDLVLSIKRIDLSTKKENSARLTIESFQLQLVPVSQDKDQRSLNSALLPEIIFNVGYVSMVDARRLAFQAAGKSLDLRLTSQFIIPATEIQKSVAHAAEKLRIASASWVVPADTSVPTATPRRKPFFGKKRMESLLVDADFAGAVVYLSGKKAASLPSDRTTRSPQAGKYGQFKHADASSNTVLRAPGLAWKIEYKDNGINEPSLNAEVKVDASSNTLYPAVVPVIMEISSAVKDMVSDEDTEAKKETQAKALPQKFMATEDDNILTADPSAVLGKTQLNLGLRICKQEFSLSCQPIARVAATAKFDDIYLTVNTVRSTEHGHFFAVSGAISKLKVSVQHVYSRESTGSFYVDSVFLSLMNSKHVSGTSGMSAILKISPMKVLVNARQLQDFLLFREIWVPPEVRQSQPAPTPTTSATQSQKFLVQRYQEVAATGAFPWNATVSVAELDVQLDLGQALCRSTFMISNLWVSSKKNSDWEQNLCLGFDKVGVDSTGRMSGFVELQNFKVRTSIQWPAREMALNQTPLVQGSVGFSQFRVKAAFDHQPFLVAHITSFEFLMYNVRNSVSGKGDRLVAILDGESVQVFCTTTTASQALALYQAFLRLVQEKRTNFEASLHEIEKFMKRRTASQAAASPLPKDGKLGDETKLPKSPISLHTDVIVTLKAVNIGAFPNTFADHQVFKLEALNAQARFAVNMDDGKIHSILGLTLGQLRIGLAGVRRMEEPKSVGEISVEDVVSSVIGSRGGTILKVPKVEATMQTWQVPNSNHIDYIFKSSFEGKVEVGWNYSRISYIRSMWASHSKGLAQRLGKPLPPSAVKITGVPGESTEEGKEGQQHKITAEVNVPQSKYDYTALETPIIETPQLKDMGEATPPLEWIGLHREKLPNVTHQIVIVTLLELANEVEDAYSKILGTS